MDIGAVGERALCRSESRARAVEIRIHAGVLRLHVVLIGLLGVGGFLPDGGGPGVGTPTCTADLVSAPSCRGPNRASESAPDNPHYGPGVGEIQL